MGNNQSFELNKRQKRFILESLQENINKIPKSRTVLKRGRGKNPVERLQNGTMEDVSNQPFIDDLKDMTIDDVSGKFHQSDKGGFFIIHMGKHRVRARHLPNDFKKIIPERLLSQITIG